MSLVVYVYFLSLGAPVSALAFTFHLLPGLCVCVHGITSILRSFFPRPPSWFRPRYLQLGWFQQPSPCFLSWFGPFGPHPPCCRLATL